MQAINRFGGTVSLGIKEAKRQGLRGKELTAYKSKAWGDYTAEQEQKAKELEKAQKAYARKQKKAAQR